MATKSRARQKRHEQVLDTLLAEIAARYRPGQLFHTQRELMARFRAGYPTIDRVIRTLKERGVLESRPRKGLFVKSLPLPPDMPAVTICVFLRDPEAIQDPIQSAFHHGLTRAAEQFAFKLKLLRLRRDDDEMLADFGEADGRGILFLQDDQQTGLIARVRAAGIPHVVVHPFRGKYEHSIEIDDADGVRQAIVALAGAGARRILFAHEPVRSAHEQAKLDGYRVGLTAAGLPHDPALEVEADTKAVVTLMKQCRAIAARRQEYDGLMVMDPRILEFVCGVFAEENVRVGHDIRLAVYGIHGYTREVTDPIGIVEVPYGRAAREGLKHLIHACQNPEYSPGTHLLRPRFYWREP